MSKSNSGLTNYLLGVSMGFLVGCGSGIIIRGHFHKNLVEVMSKLPHLLPTEDKGVSRDTSKTSPAKNASPIYKY